MRETVAAYLPWLLSAITISHSHPGNDKFRHVWLLGVGDQALWLIWIVYAPVLGRYPVLLKMAHLA
ncbi:hypothetical protein ATN84_22935 [Paramesorhizobium deserti]|uniref:Uncharacterized protein n=1 Tax=Paramesorhizobium deserti TaxID=1494590 RepID=A0A135HNF8_9HYPH|nr:hypothetical protein ATN84_22935 [Paramesorhizobium deserti]